MSLRNTCLALIATALWLPQIAWSATAEKKTWDYLQVSSIKWHTYDQAALNQARQLNRPIFVFVFLNTCHWCHKYETETLETAKITKRLKQDYFPIAIDSAKHPDLLKQLGVTVVPTTLLLTPERRKIVKFQGHVDARDLADILDANLFRWRKGEITGEEFGDPAVCCPLDPPASK